MGIPITFEKPLSSYGYHMEVDTAKKYCCREPAHWHLVHGRSRVGQIWVDSLLWEEEPDVGRSIQKEAEALTSTWSDEIKNAYFYNREHGSDD